MCCEFLWCVTSQGILLVIFVCVLVCFLFPFFVCGHCSRPPPVPQNSISMSLFFVQLLSQCVFAVLSLSCPALPPTQRSVGGGGRVLYLLDSLLRSGSLYIVVLYMLWICLGVCLRVPYLLSGEEGKDGKFGCSFVGVI